jgi:N-acetyl-anhydromuramyl-L-alanine amidase AmpD
MSILDQIVWSPLPANQFIAEETPKSMIFLHHTASSPSPYGVLSWWMSNVERVGTSFVIAGKPGKDSRYTDGQIIQAFSSKHWGWHLGLKKSDLVPGGKTSTWLNSNSIGLEICNWGQLTRDAKGFRTYAGAYVDKSEVVEYQTLFRGYKYYQRYTDAQLESTRKLLKYLGDTWDIDLKYKGDEIFDVDRRALMGESGVFSHTSVRKDKFDCHPQTELIQMLKSL